MGGYNSGRWHDVRTRATTQSSKRLEIKKYKDVLRQLEKVKEPGMIGIADIKPNWTYTHSGKPDGEVGLHIEGSGDSITATVSYQVEYKLTGGKQNYHNVVGFEFTPGFGGSKCWYWRCPKCGERCGVLYMPNGTETFACRKCYNLTYNSCKDSHKNGAMFRKMAGWMADTMPGMSGEEMRQLWEHDRLPQRFYDQAIQETLARWQERANQDPYPGYLTAAEFCDQAGLTPGELQELETARLLIADRPSGRYRPKLKSWAVKLSYLLRAGWTIAELRSWSKGRWKTANPRQWPPDRAAWQIAQPNNR